MESIGYRGSPLESFRDRFLETSASSPSLRASEPATSSYVNMANGNDGDSGNVKVVVRVRQFIPRGK